MVQKWVRVLKDEIKIIPSAIVHATAVSCPSKSKYFVKLLIISTIIIYDTN